MINKALSNLRDKDFSLLNVNVLDRICRLNELLIESLERAPEITEINKSLPSGRPPSWSYSPNCLGDRPCRLLSLEHVTGEPLHGGMFRDEADVAMVPRMKCAK